jgi:hypothetical protein
MFRLLASTLKEEEIPKSLCGHVLGLIALNPIAKYDAWQFLQANWAELNEM